MIKAVLFDLDGTLLNTNELILQTFEYTLRTVLNISVPREQLIQTFGRPLYDVMKEFDAQKAPLLLETYRNYNFKIHDQVATIFPTAVDTLKHLQQKGILLAIVTSKKSDIALRGLSLFHLEQYFDAFIASEDTIQHKPNPEPLLKALAMLNVLPQEAIMVGDSPYDILAGKNAGTKTVGVTYTAHGPQSLLQYQPDFMIEQLIQLTTIITSQNI